MSWRDHFQIHPSAEVFPLLSEPELQKLAADIEKNGLRVPIQTCTVDGTIYVVDGRNRLDAMESLGWQFVNDRGEWIGALATVPGTTAKVGHKNGRTHKQVAADVIALNIRRRHLTKDEQVALIDKAIRAANGQGTTTTSANMAAVVKRPQGGGTQPNPVRSKVIKEAAKLGISKRTVERTLAKAKTPKTPKPKAKIDKTSEGFVVKRFQRWLDFWTVQDQRKVRPIVNNYTSR